MKKEDQSYLYLILFHVLVGILAYILPFTSKIYGNSKCFAHSECDAIIKDNAKVKATPEITANNVDANLIHEAAIGKIAGEQLTKLMTLGLSEKEAEEQIITGFLG